MEDGPVPSTIALGSFAATAVYHSSCVATAASRGIKASAARDPNAIVLGTGPFSIAAPYIVFAEDYPNEDFQKRLLPRIRGVLQAGNYKLVVRRGAVSAWKADPSRKLL